MPPQPDPLFFGIELLFTVLMIILSFAIYRRTKESYDLTKYAGIKYFRDAFLFFGLSYVARFLFSALMFSHMTFDLEWSESIIIPFLILLMGYFSTVAIFYLIFCTTWKRFTSAHLVSFTHVIAAILSIIAFATRSHEILLVLQSILLVIAILLGFFSRTIHANKKSKMRWLYVMVSILWLITLLTVGMHHPFLFGIGIASQVILIIAYIILYSKIAKWAQ